MNISNINFRKVEKSKLIRGLSEGEFESPSKKELKEMFKKFEIAMASGDYLTARNASIVNIYFQPEEFVSIIRKKGVFRYSRYINKKCIVKNIAFEILEIYKTFVYNFESIEVYLNSIINYSIIIDSYHSFDEFILTGIKGFEKKYPRKSLIKTLLSSVDYLFLSNYYPKEKSDLSNISGRTKEEISSAVSFLIYFYTDRVKSTKIDTVFVAEEYVISGEISKLILPACYYLDFREFEILIDHFGYGCQLEDHKLLIKAPFEDFEKAIRLGYIRTDLQIMNDKVEVNDALSFEELVDKLNELKNLQFFQLTETHNYPRYRVEMPEPIFDILIENFIKPDALFKEEIIYLSSIFKEQLLSFEDLKKVKLRDDLTLEEFMKIRRVFVIFYLLFAKEIYKKEKVETDLLLRSLIPVYPEPQFYEIVDKLLPSSKIDSFLDIVCWEPGLETVFDLQYHPVLYLNSHFLLPLSIFANSNVIRNVYASEYKRDNVGLLRDGEIDPLVGQLVLALNEASIQNFSQTSIGFSDIDVFAIYEDVLFVFECKHTLHPVSPFDLRTIYDYIKKAEKQLDLITKDFESGNLLKKLREKHEIKTDTIKKIQCVIVVSNRLFNGNIFKYPVRNLNEIDNMLNRGTLRTDNGEFWLWTEKRLSIDFLLEYFSLDNKLFRLLYRSLSKRTITYKFATPVIEFETYYLDLETGRSIMKEFTNDLEKKEAVNEMP